MENLQYPVGKLSLKKTYTAEELNVFKETIRNFPELIMSEVKDVTTSILDTPYRPDGWTVKQVIHHLADSHINAYTRFKRALTEDEPEVHGYLEKKWAELSDAKSINIQASLVILQGIHSRWSSMLDSMSLEDYDKKYYHLQNEHLFTLSEALANYDWHCRHHLAHIQLVTQQIS